MKCIEIDDREKDMIVIGLMARAGNLRDCADSPHSISSSTRQDWGNEAMEYRALAEKIRSMK